MSDIREILKEVLFHCIDMQRLAETKNAGLLAFNGAIILSVSRYMLDTNLSVFLRAYFGFITFCCVISIFLNIAAISARIKNKKLEPTLHKSENLLFFAEIANFLPEIYLDRINTEYFENREKITPYYLDLAKQIVINARIALRKFELFNCAFKWSICAITTPIGVLAFLILFSDGKEK